jgi:quinohemoprotein ethanol dehydrogenase
VGGGSGIPDLRYARAQTHAQFSDIVLGGQRVSGGMPAFADRLDPEQVRQIQAWVLARAADDHRAAAARATAAAP